jgi:hypothetical protein
MRTSCRVLIHHRPISWAVAALLTLVASVGWAAGPSTDRDHPTPLTSNGIKGTSTEKAGEYYYSFIAGPGEVALTLDAMHGSMPGYLCSSSSLPGLFPCTTAEAELFDMNAERLLSVKVQSQAGKSERKVGRVKIRNRQPLVMRVRLDANAEWYLARVEGAVQFGQAGQAGETPSSHHGKLHIEMDDGSVQDVDLSHVRRLTIEP